MVYIYAKAVPEQARFLLGKFCIILSFIIICSIPISLGLSFSFA